MSQNKTDIDTDELLRTARTHRNKAIRFEGEAEDGERVTWFVAYRGKFGWIACRDTGERSSYDPPTSEVRESFNVYDRAELVDISDTPDAVEL